VRDFGNMLSEQHRVVGRKPFGSGRVSSGGKLWQRPERIHVRVHTQEFEVPHDAIDQRGAPAGLWVTDEHTFFQAYFCRAEQILDPVVIDEDVPVAGPRVKGEMRPTLQRIGDVFPEFFEQRHVLLERFEHPLQLAQYMFRSDMAEVSAPLMDEAHCVGERLDAVQLGDTLKQWHGFHLVGLDGLQHVTPQMYRALEVRDVRSVLKHIGMHFGRIGLRIPFPVEREEVVQDCTAAGRRELKDHRLLVRDGAAPQKVIVRTTSALGVDQFGVGLIELHVATRQDLLFELVADRDQQVRHHFHVARTRLARDKDATAGIDPLLPIRRQVIDVLGDDHVREEADSHARLRGQRRHQWRMFARRVCIRGANRVHHAKPSGLDLKLFGDLVAHPHEARLLLLGQVEHLARDRQKIGLPMRSPTAFFLGSGIGPSDCIQDQRELLGGQQAVIAHGAEHQTLRIVELLAPDAIDAVCEIGNAQFGLLAADPFDLQKKFDRAYPLLGGRKSVRYFDRDIFVLGGGHSSAEFNASHLRKNLKLLGDSLFSMASVRSRELNTSKKKHQQRGAYALCTGLSARPVQWPTIEPLAGHVKPTVVIPQERHTVKRTLYRKAKGQPQWRARSLYGQLCRREVLQKALKTVLSNAGAPGVDGAKTKRAKAKSAAFVDEMQQQLQGRSYRSQPVSNVYLNDWVIR
jgi:hypothetical protein